MPGNVTRRLSDNAANQARNVPAPRSFQLPQQPSQRGSKPIPVPIRSTHIRRLLPTPQPVRDGPPRTTREKDPVRIGGPKLGQPVSQQFFRCVANRHDWNVIHGLRICIESGPGCDTIGGVLEKLSQCAAIGDHEVGCEKLESGHLVILADEGRIWTTQSI